uniref:Uncharacterized protein n=1 Tax=Seriola dumerili TaxID=41447 RepID=A0A3B4UIM8_SERDU
PHSSATTQYLMRGIWEVRVKKYRHKQKKEQERVEKSAL